MAASEHFDRLAPRYAQLRRSGKDDLLMPFVVELAGLAKVRVLDIGCGSGASVRRLVLDHGCEAVGLDASAAMVEAARVEGPGDYVVGAAEALPFPDDTFDAALAQLVVHHLDRPRAFAEIRRVLRSSGRLAITTTDPAAFPTFWMQAFFPSYAAIERARFPDGETLRRELGGAGFRQVEIVHQAIPRRFSREDALAKLTGRAYSTFVHMSETEYEAGVVAAAERLPDVVEYELRLLHVLAA